MAGRSWEGNESIRDELPNAGKTPQVPEGVNVAFSVSIDVMVGGYTGQRDQWEANTRPWRVTVDDDGWVTLVSGNTTGDIIRFNKDGLLAALKILKDYKR